MRRSLAILLIIGIALLGAGGVGEKAPVVRLSDLKGAEVSTASHAGKPRVYVFFAATWSPESMTLLKDLGATEKSLREKGVLTLGISLDTAGGATVEAAAKKQGIEIPLLQAGPAASRAFNVSHCPTTFVIDSGGTIKNRFEGPVAVKSIESAARAVIP
jgi:peroxiredoxin